MAFEPGNQEWKNRKACKGGRPSKQELEKRVLEKEEWDRTVRAYATLEATRFMRRLFRIPEGACPLCRKTA